VLGVRKGPQLSGESTSNRFCRFRARVVRGDTVLSKDLEVETSSGGTDEEAEGKETEDEERGEKGEDDDRDDRDDKDSTHDEDDDDEEEEEEDDDEGEGEGEGEEEAEEEEEEEEEEVPTGNGLTFSSRPCMTSLRTSSHLAWILRSQNSSKSVACRFTITNLPDSFFCFDRWNTSRGRLRAGSILRLVPRQMIRSAPLHSR